MGNDLLDELGELPRNKANLSFYYQFDDRTRAGFSVRYRDQRKVITGNQAMAGASALVRLDSYITVDALLEYRLGPDDRKEKDESGTKRVNSKLAVAIENLTDEDYEESAGFPMPGRTLAVSLTLEF